MKGRPSPPASYPFPYYGAGSAGPIREKDGLLSVVVFERPLPVADRDAIVASVPGPVRRVRSGRRWLSLESSDRLATDVRAWAKQAGEVIGTSTGAAYARLAQELERWIRALHATHPVALFFVGSDGEHGAWHDDTVQRFAEGVRSSIEALREEGETAHADWIAASFLRSGATGSFDDLRGLAESDPPALVGDVYRRCRLALPLVDALGPAALSAAGPYAELGFWACASVSELAPDLPAHARHLVALADACGEGRQLAAAQLLVMAAESTLLDTMPLAVRVEQPDRTPRPRPEAFEAALAMAQRAAKQGALPVAALGMLVDAARANGGPARAMAMAKPFLSATLAAMGAAVAAAEAPDAFARAQALKGDLEKDLSALPDAEVARALSQVPAPPAEEQPIRGARQPHLARLNGDRLEVRYHGSDVDQVVSIHVTASRDAGARAAQFYAGRIANLVSTINAGLAGVDVFPPEAGGATLLEGSPAAAPGPEYTFRVRLRGVDPRFWAIALSELADTPLPQHGTAANPVRGCPVRIRILGELAPDGTRASATTDTVLGSLRDLTPAFAAWPEVPFDVRTKGGKGPFAALKPQHMSAQAFAWIAERAWTLGPVLGAHPEGGAGILNKEAGKTQIKLTWTHLDCPAQAARGPILNLARRMHFDAAPLAAVELGL
jgi:hypothetical protein